MEGGAKLIKYLVVFFNFIFFVFGCVLIGYGAWALIELGDYSSLTEGSYAAGSKVMIAAGVLIALISFFGCCGAWKENRCLLIIFFICLLVILSLEIAVAILGYTNRNKVENELDDEVKEAIRGKYVGDQPTKDAIDALQREESCCGWNNYTNWFNSKFDDGKRDRVPDSCCKKETDGCGKTIGDNINEEGCKEKLEKLIKDKLYYIGALAVTIVVIQLIGMIFALVLTCRIGKEGSYA
ncbi:CD63 antigen-like [Montipora capricornis]|uniref:CD63 antigen-like n=1 Tax=Montipora capricornis TaxID=246305 RepID=UPI0035F16819